uniref:Uncharacterized protein n=2 Tax=Palpitomonas bilix TaxID=652834 RepID=A0A7S3LWE7_9EUKA|mmetsp:Transcript_6468/g.16033  ORF Transcript_6468/g.16033 Transcript_6468/m.16033 type:complete len:599 (+) Transcript_6468:324-2120(+)
MESFTVGGSPALSGGGGGGDFGGGNPFLGGAKKGDQHDERQVKGSQSAQLLPFYESFHRQTQKLPMTVEGGLQRLVVMNGADYTPLSLDDVRDVKGFEDTVAPKKWAKRFDSNDVERTYEAPLEERRQRWEKEGRLSPPPQWKNKAVSRLAESPPRSRAATSMSAYGQKGGRDSDARGRGAPRSHSAIPFESRGGGKKGNRGKGGSGGSGEVSVEAARRILGFGASSTSTSVTATASHLPSITEGRKGASAVGRGMSMLNKLKQKGMVSMLGKVGARDVAGLFNAAGKDKADRDFKSMAGVGGRRLSIESMASQGGGPEREEGWDDSSVLSGDGRSNPMEVIGSKENFGVYASKEVAERVYLDKCAEYMVTRPILDISKMHKSGVLDLTSFSIDAVHAKALGHYLASASPIDYLILKNIHIGDGGMAHLYNAVAQNKGIFAIRLDSVGITKLGSSTLLTFLTKKDFQRISLSGNKLGIKLLRDVIQHIIYDKNIEQLDMSNVKTEKPPAIEYAYLIKKNTKLKEIGLARNGFKAEGVRQLVKGLPFNSTLRFLDLSHNQLGEKGGLLLAKGLTDACRIETLFVHSNQLGPRATLMLVR